MRMSAAELAKEHARISGILDCPVADCSDCCRHQVCADLSVAEKKYLAEGYKDFRGYMLAKLKHASESYDEEYKKEQIWNITKSIASGG